MTELPKILEEDKNISMYNTATSSSIILPSKSSAGGIISRAAAV